MYGIYNAKSNLLCSDGSLEAGVWTAKNETLGNNNQLYNTKEQRRDRTNDELSAYFEKNYPLLMRLNYVVDRTTI